MYDIQHCFICRSSDSTVSKDAGIEPRTVASTALAVRRSNHSARSHPPSARSHPLYPSIYVSSKLSTLFTKRAEKLRVSRAMMPTYARLTLYCNVKPGGTTLHLSISKHVPGTWACRPAWSRRPRLRWSRCSCWWASSSASTTSWCSATSATSAISAGGRGQRRLWQRVRLRPLCSKRWALHEIVFFIFPVNLRIFSFSFWGNTKVFLGRKTNFLFPSVHNLFYTITFSQTR